MTMPVRSRSPSVNGLARWSLGARTPSPSKPGSTEEARASGYGWVLRSSWDNGLRRFTDQPQGAPIRCYQRTTPTGYTQPSTTAAWWPARDSSSRRHWPAGSACSSWSTTNSTSAMRRGGRTRATSCSPWSPPHSPAVTASTTVTPCAQAEPPLCSAAPSRRRPPWARFCAAFAGDMCASSTA